MKKIITLLIFLSVGILSAQTYTDYDKQEGRYWRGYKGTTLAQYVYVVNDSTSLAFLDSLITDLATSKGYLLNIKQNGDSIIVLVNLTNTRLSSVITDLDSIIVLHNLTNTKLDTLEITANAIEVKVSTAAKQDTAEVTLNAIETAVELLDNSVDGGYLNVNTNFAGVDASVNTGDADGTTQRVVLATDQPTIPVTLSPTDTVTVKSIVNALPAGTNLIGKFSIDQVTANANEVVVKSITAGDNNIGNVDIVTLPSGNLGQQLSAASLSVTPATNITDATYIGDIKFGESLPAGTAIIGQFGIDQTTPGTTNKVSIGADGTVAATQSGTWTVQPGNTANTTAWKVDGSAVTQPVSSTNLDIRDLTVVDTVTIKKIVDAVAVTGTFWQATQPISGTFWQTTQPVSGTFWQTTQPVSLASVPSHAVTNAGTFAVQASIPGNTTFGYGANAITVVEALGGDVTCKKVTITNFTANEIIYVGSDALVTTSNGFPLGYMDTYTITVSNLNKVFLISDGTSVDVRYTYEN
uniref:Uncharacterized protein n=1 Tax=viral metagenome TaxID=1070528 RepID=A0A6M3IZ30_9ZZZZ